MATIGHSVSKRLFICGSRLGNVKIISAVSKRGAATDRKPLLAALADLVRDDGVDEAGGRERAFRGPLAPLGGHRRGDGCRHGASGYDRAAASRSFTISK